VFLVKYELGFYIPADDILHSHRRENLKSYILRVYQNRVLKRIIGTKRDEVTGGWRKLHNEGHYNLAKYS
jgi:hypothetical protein